MSSKIFNRIPKSLDLRIKLNKRMHSINICRVQDHVPSISISRGRVQDHVPIISVGIG